MRKGIGLPQSQLLIIEGVPKYAAHHRNVLREEEEKSDTRFRASSEGGETQAGGLMFGRAGSISRYLGNR